MQPSSAVLEFTQRTGRSNSLRGVIVNSNLYGIRFAYRARLEHIDRFHVGDTHYNNVTVVSVPNVKTVNVGG